MNLTEFLENLFSNKTTSWSFKMFGLKHILVLCLIFGSVYLLAILLKNKSEQTKDKICRISAYLLVGLYIFDFFVQPFWTGTGYMTVSKLPFHICTFTGILLTFVTFNKKFEKLKVLTTVWAVGSATAYFLFPFGMSENTSMLSYSVLQPYLYHAVELFWGVYMLFSGKTQLKWSTIWQPIVGLFPMALWATIGQKLYYPNEIGENLMALFTDVSGIVPRWVYLLALFTAAVIGISLIYGIYNLIVYIKQKRKQSA